MSLLPNESQVNPSSAFWAPGVASGGGGGGGGTTPNPAFSTIILNDGVLTTNSGANGFVFQNSTTAVLQDAFLQSNTVPLAAGAGTANTFQLNSISGSNNTLTIGAGNDNASYIWTGGGGTQDGSQALFIKSAGVFMSSLNCSSINGAAPGGGGSVPSNLQLSTLAFGGSSNPSVYMENKTILLNQAAAVPSVGSAGLSWNNSSSNIQLIAPSTTAVYIGTEKLEGSVLVLDNGVRCSRPLTVTDQPTALSSIFQIAATDTNLYSLDVTDSNAALLAGISIGTIGGRNQVYISSNAQVQNSLWVSSIQNCKEAFVSSLSVSSVNGAAPGGGLTNLTIPFITGSGDGTTWTINVDSNTGGNPVALTSTLITSAANSYLVNYSLFGGSNSDTAQFTKLSIYTASGSGNPIIQTCPGLVSNNWLSNGFMGARSLIVSGASAIRLQAEDYSPTVSTLLYFDQQTSFKVTNLGASS